MKTDIRLARHDRIHDAKQMGYMHSNSTVARIDANLRCQRVRHRFCDRASNGNSLADRDVADVEIIHAWTVL